MCSVIYNLFSIDFNVLLVLFMRFLKTKIRLAREASSRKAHHPLDILYKDLLTPISTGIQIEENLDTPSTKTLENSAICHPAPRASSTNKGSSSLNRTLKSPPLKNLVVNYGNAMATFALSYIAIPYLRPLLEAQGVTNTDFSSFLTCGKSGIKGIHGFRSLLLIEEKDDKTTIACKKIFKYICEVFIKSYSVNWITHSRIQHKMEYIKYRFKMLRRVQEPEYFTSIIT